MSDLKWVFQLRQHTPMIHFQSSEAGVCLRATEVKPKFDRFLLANVVLTDTQKEKWFYESDSGELSSKMKMRFKALSEPSIVSRINPLYFGNMGIRELEDRNKAIFFNKPIEGIIFCFDPQFLEIIKKYIPIFFLLNTFGTRQDKGFGSFSVTGEERINVNPQVIQNYEPNAYYLDYQQFRNINYHQKLDDIRLLYGLMKGGINNTWRNPEYYYKSALFRYYMERGITHEKKVIKSILFDSGCLENLENTYYVRAVLGITDQYLYPHEVYVSVSNEDIKRYQSPIYFKVLGRYTFLYLRQMPEELKKAVFCFSVPGKKNKFLEVPEFDIEDFMKWFAADFNNKDKILGGGGALIRGSLKAADNPDFERIEELKLRRCGK